MFKLDIVDNEYHYQIIEHKEGDIRVLKITLAWDEEEVAKFEEVTKAIEYCLEKMGRFNKGGK